MNQDFQFLKCCGLITTLFFFGLAACGEDDDVVSPPDPLDTVEAVLLNEFHLLEPINSWKDVPVIGEFSWTSAGEGAIYSLTINAKHSPDFLKFESITDTVFTLPEPMQKATIYEWSVTATDGKNREEGSREVFEIRTEFAMPSPSPDQHTYYVSPLGKDDPSAGTPNDPFKTVAYAARLMPTDENDTIRLAAGEYVETEEIILGTGINLVGAGVGQTTLSSSQLLGINGLFTNDYTHKEKPAGSLIQLVSPNFVAGQGSLAAADGNQVLSGFTIDGQGKSLKAGVWVSNRNNVEINHLEIIDSDMRGIVVSKGVEVGVGSDLLTGIKLHDLTFKNSGKYLPNEEILGNLCLGALDGAEVYNIDIEDDEGYGIKFIFRGYYRNSKFYNIRTELNENAPIWGEGIAIELWNLGPGNELYDIEANTWISLVNDSDVFGELGEQKNVIVHDLKIIDEDGVSNKEGVELAVPHSELYDIYVQDKGFGIAIWNMGREDILIRNSIFYNTSYKYNWTGGPAIYIDNSRDWDFKDINIYNNVFDTHNIGVRIKGERISNISIANNLFISTQNEDLMAEAEFVQLLHNLKDTQTLSSWNTVGADTLNNLVGQADILGEGNRWDEYYLPLTGSPLIDAGVDIGLPYFGTSPDIGAIETQP